MATTTTEAPSGYSPDLVAYVAAEEIPQALAIQAGTQVGTVNGDEASVVVPFELDDEAADFTLEKDPIPEEDVPLGQLELKTHKLSRLWVGSSELMSNARTATQIVNTLKRGIVKKADDSFLNHATAPTGLMALSDLPPVEQVGPNLDALAGIIGDIEADDGEANVIIAAPDAWTYLSTIKTEDTSNQPLLGAGVQAGQRQVLGVPVLVSAKMAAGGLLVADKGSIITALGSLNLAKSVDYAFNRDAVAVRLTWRLGFGVTRSARVRRMTVAAPVAG